MQTSLSVLRLSSRSFACRKRLEGQLMFSYETLNYEQSLINIRLLYHYSINRKKQSVAWKTYVFFGTIFNKLNNYALCHLYVCKTRVFRLRLDILSAFYCHRLRWLVWLTSFNDDFKMTPLGQRFGQACCIFKAIIQKSNLTQLAHCATFQCAPPFLSTSVCLSFFFL